MTTSPTDALISQKNFFLFSWKGKQSVRVFWGDLMMGGTVFVPNCDS
jgi:hypothetical protein